MRRSNTYQFYSFWLDSTGGSNLRYTALETGTLTITTPMRFLSHVQHISFTYLWYKNDTVRKVLFKSSDIILSISDYCLMFLF